MSGPVSLATAMWETWEARIRAMHDEGNHAGCGTVMPFACAEKLRDSTLA